MINFPVNKVREEFIKFFKFHGHQHVQSSPLVPHNDPTLMFTNSGMVQFKDLFTGSETRAYSKAVTSQKCVRAGGKHNDLDNVGYTARHHTFFEMLGNFSFGDYFKEEAIEFAWNMLTKVFLLPKDKLYITIYHDDEDAYKLWKKISNFSDDKIIRISTNDNFWSMGDTGPCGPCSEIFFDHGDKIYGGLPGTKDEDGDRYIEIWNLVFMQYEQIDKNNRILLPKKSVDTGMGLERISAVLQSVHDNYSIDIFRELIDYISSVIKLVETDETLISCRVIADHIRSVSFLIADGVLPSNEGRGYVLRRIMRRAMRHAHQLGAKDPVMYKIAPKLIELMGGTYSELIRAQDLIVTILKQEEEKFKITLDRGLKLLDDSLHVIENNILSGDVAFKLYDTYGFPLDLTQDILKSHNISVDIDAFEQQMAHQRDLARKSWSGSGECKTDQIWYDIMSEFGPTEFVGYSMAKVEGKILAIVQNGIRVSELDFSNEQLCTIITDQTSFYGESGGQVGDIGTISSSGAKVKVVNTLKYCTNLYAHICNIEEGSLRIGDYVTMSINEDYRNSIKAHHSAVHILHAALYEILGNHISQKGSLVAHDRLRFDISHHKAISKTELKQIEDSVNNIIINNTIVSTKLMSADEAIISGAKALFGEKYGDEVRVISMGKIPISQEADHYSSELCGGTHVQRTGDIGLFKITGERAIAAGIRRIEAVCGKAALDFVTETEDLLDMLVQDLGGSRSEARSRLANLINSNKMLEKAVANGQISKLLDDTRKLLPSIEGNVIICNTEITDVKVIRTCLDSMFMNSELIIVYLSAIEENKTNITIGVHKNLSNKYSANIIASKIALDLGAKGGGSSTLAQLCINTRSSDIMTKVKLAIDSIVTN